MEALGVAMPLVPVGRVLTAGSPLLMGYAPSGALLLPSSPDILQYMHTLETDRL